MEYCNSCADRGSKYCDQCAMRKQAAIDELRERTEKALQRSRRYKGVIKKARPYIYEDMLELIKKGNIYCEVCERMLSFEQLRSSVLYHWNILNRRTANQFVPACSKDCAGLLRRLRGRDWW